MKRRTCSSSEPTKGPRTTLTQDKMEFEPDYKPKDVLDSFQVYDEEFYRSEVIKPVSPSSSASSFRLPDIIMTDKKKGILKNRITVDITSPRKSSGLIDMKANNNRKSRPAVSLCFFFLLISLFLILLLIGIDQLGFPTLIEACYKFPEGVRDPCSDLECKYGSECIRTRDGKKAECVCPHKCFTYGDSVGSRPVCGSDGRDYPNDCELRRRACSLNASIESRFPGRCDPCDSVDCPSNQVCQLDETRNPICRCNAICNQEFKPVCASDGECIPLNDFMDNIVPKDCCESQLRSCNCVYTSQCIRWLGFVSVKSINCFNCFDWHHVFENLLLRTR